MIYSYLLSEPELRADNFSMALYAKGMYSTDVGVVGSFTTYESFVCLFR